MTSQHAGPVASTRMTRALLVLSLVALGMLIGCSSTKLSNRQEYQGPKLPRPGRIIVYDFAATPADLPDWSMARQAYSQASTRVDDADLAAGRKLGAAIAKEIVEQIGDMGLNAVRAAAQPEAALNDLVLTGYFTSVEAGSSAERMLIGFGKGSSNVGVHAEGYHMTAEGMVKLGGAALDDGGAGKSPGLVVPAIVTIATANPIGLVVSGVVKAEGEVSGRTTEKGAAKRIADEIADVLEQKFEEQGWL